MKPDLNEFIGKKCSDILAVALLRRENDSSGHEAEISEE